MLELAPVSAIHNPQGYTTAEVLNELRGKRGTRSLTFRYELLDSANVFIQDLDNVLACTIEQNWLADIKRKANFTVKDTGEIDFLSNRIKPYARLNMSPVPTVVLDDDGEVLNANPYFETDASNWTALSGGTVARSTAQAHEGDASLLFTPNGVTATVETRSENALGVVAGQTYRVPAWVRCAAARSVNANIVWRDAAGTFLSSAGAVSLSVAADTWAQIVVSGTAPTSAAQAQISVSMGSTPPASHLLYIDEARLIAPRIVLVDGGFVEWPQGVFLLSSPVRNADETDTVIRDVEAYDALQVYLDDKVEDRYTVATGAVYTTAVSTLLGSIAKNVATSTKTLPVAMEWDPGTPKLKIINNLLSAINYESLSFNEDGVAIVQPYTSPATRAEEYTYADNEDSVMIPEVDQELDLFAIPNKWVLVVSEPDRAPLIGTYTNNDPASPTSTVRRQRTIVDFRTETEAADQTALDERVARLAFEASQIYEAVGFTTAVMPIHSGNDVYRITYSTLAIDAKYSEHSWSMPLVSGGTMKHQARRVVTI